MRISDWSSDVCASDLVEMLAAFEVIAEDVAQHEFAIDKADHCGNRHHAPLAVLEPADMNQQLDRGCDLPTECRFAAGVAGKSRQQLHAVNGIARGVGVQRDRKSTRLNSSH